MAARNSRCCPKDCSSQPFHTIHFSLPIYESLLQIQILSRTETFRCSDFLSRMSWWGWHHNSWFLDWRILWHYCVWSVNRNLGCYIRLSWFNLLWSQVIYWSRWHWWHRITCPSCNFIKIGHQYSPKHAWPAIRGSC